MQVLFLFLLLLQGEDLKETVSTVGEKVRTEIAELDVVALGLVALHSELHGDNVRAESCIEATVDSFGGRLSENGLDHQGLDFCFNRNFAQFLSQLVLLLFVERFSGYLLVEGKLFSKELLAQFSLHLFVIVHRDKVES